MKKSITFVCIVALAICTATAGNFGTSIDKDPKTVTEQITKLLESPEFEVTKEIVTKVTLVVNKDLEVFVLDMDTDNEEVNSFIKSRLNNATLDIAEPGEKVILPVRILPAS